MTYTLKEHQAVPRDLVRAAMGKGESVMLADLPPITWRAPTTPTLSAPRPAVLPPLTALQEYRRAVRVSRGYYGAHIGTYLACSAACERTDLARARELLRLRRAEDRRLTAEHGLGRDEQLHRQVSAQLADMRWQSKYDDERYSRSRELSRAVDDAVSRQDWQAWEAWMLIHRRRWEDIAEDTTHVARADERAAKRAVRAAQGKPWKPSAVLPSGTVSDATAISQLLALSPGAAAPVTGTCQLASGGTLARRGQTLYYTPRGGTTAERDVRDAKPGTIRNWIGRQRAAVIAVRDVEHDDRIAAIAEA